MKAIPMNSQHQRVSKDQATHLKLRLPGPTGYLVLPVITSGARKDTPNWSWNGSLEAPTLRPSVRSELKLNGVDPDGIKGFVCHSWITDGKVQFLGDCTHELANTTVDLLDADS